MVEQESLPGLGRPRVEVPRPGPLADGVPGPDRVAVHPFHQLDLDLDAPGAADHPDPVVIDDAQFPGRGAGHIEAVGAVDLAQPGVLRAPGMIHRHRPLGDGVQGVIARQIFFEGRIPDRQGIEVFLDAGAVLVRRLDRPVALGGEAEALHLLQVKLADDRLVVDDEAHLDGIGQIVAVDVAEVLDPGRQFLAPEALVLDVAVQLIGVGFAIAGLVSVGAAPAGERSDAGAALMIDDVIGIAAGVLGPAVVVDHAGEAQSGAEIEQHVLERTHVAVGRDHRLADGVGRAVGAADRAVEQGDAVEALQIRGVGQHQIGVGHGLGVEGVGINEPGDLVLAGFGVLVGQHADGVDGVHGRVPRYVGHVHEQGVDGIGIALPGVGDDHVHHAVGGQGGFPGKGLVDALRPAAGADQQILRRPQEAEMRTRQRRVRVDVPLEAEGTRKGRQRFGVRRFVTEAAGAVDGAQQHL